MYIPLNTIKTVEPVEFALTKKEHCLKIVTKSAVYFLSVDSSDLKTRHEIVGHDDVSDETNDVKLEKWMDTIGNLSQIINGTISV